MVLAPGRLRTLAEVGDEAAQCLRAAPPSLGLEYVPDKFAMPAEAGHECIFVTRVEAPGIAGGQLLDIQAIAGGDCGHECILQVIRSPRNSRTPIVRPDVRPCRRTASGQASRAGQQEPRSAV